MYAHIFTTSHCLQTTSIHLLTRGVIVNGVGDDLECDNLHSWHLSPSVAQVKPPHARDHNAISYLQLCKSAGLRITGGEKISPGRTFRPRFVCLPTNDPFKSTSIMVIHNGLVYWDPWACCCPALALSSFSSSPLFIFTPTKLSGIIQHTKTI